MIAGRIVRRWTGPTGLACGLMLFAFTTTHLINHAFGLVSFETAEQMRRSALGFWHWTFLGLLLPAALVLHVAINLYRLARRRSLHMPAWQYLQLGLGLAIPFWLVVHMLATRGLSLVHGTQVNYYLEFFLLWPGLATQQIVLTLLVWTHGCMGIHFWLRLRPLYRRLQPFLLAFAVLLFVLAAERAYRVGGLVWILLAALAFDGVLLTKYNGAAVYLGMIAGFLTTADLRRFLVTRFAVISVLALPLFLAHLYWNALHCSINLAFNFSFRTGAITGYGPLWLVLTLLIMAGPPTLILLQVRSFLARLDEARYVVAPVSAVTGGGVPSRTARAKAL